MKRVGKRNSGKWKLWSSFIEGSREGGDLFGEGRVTDCALFMRRIRQLTQSIPAFGPKTNQLLVI